MKGLKLSHPLILSGSDGVSAWPKYLDNTANVTASIFTDQNIAVNRINMARFAMILVSIDSSQRQLSIETKIVTNRAILMLFMSLF